MKLAISQIKKRLPFEFEYDYDLMSNLVNKPDIIACNNCHITGVIYESQEDRFLVRLSVKIDLIGLCAISLEEVPFHLEFKEDIYFSYEEDSEDYLIERETLNIDEAVLSEIVLNLPYRFLKDEYLDS